jgi:hypothetical protein
MQSTKSLLMDDLERASTTHRQCLIGLGRRMLNPVLAQFNYLISLEELLSSIFSEARSSRVRCLDQLEREKVDKSERTAGGGKLISLCV